MWGKEGLCNIGQKRNEKNEKKNLSLLVCLQMQAMAAAGLARLEGQGTVERWGFEDPACGEKRSLQHWSEKKRKEEEKKHILLMCPRMRQWRRRDLQGLRGEARWRGGGLRTQHVGKRGLCNGQKRNEKRRKKNITLLAYLRMQAVAVAVGVGAKGKR